MTANRSSRRTTRRVGTHNHGEARSFPPSPMMSQQEAATTPQRIFVHVEANTLADVARGIHEATLRIEQGETWGSAADTACWVRWTTTGREPNGG